MLTKRDKIKLCRKIENKGWKEICQTNSSQKHVMLILYKIPKAKRCNNHLYACNKEPLNPETGGRVRLYGWVRSWLQSVPSHCRELQDLITQHSLNMDWSVGCWTLSVLSTGCTLRKKRQSLEELTIYWRKRLVVRTPQYNTAMQWPTQTHSRCTGNTRRDS